MSDRSTLVDIQQALNYLDRVCVKGNAGLGGEPMLTEFPATLFQYWDRDPPHSIVRLQQRVKEVWPWQVVYDDIDARAFLKEFDTGALLAYEKAKHPALACDLLRLCLVYQYGGMYCDSDMTLTDDFPWLARHGGELCLMKWNRPVNRKKRRNVANWFFGAKAGHNVIGLALMSVIENLEKGVSPDKALTYTGPAILTRAIATHLSERDGVENSKIVVYDANKRSEYVLDGPQYIGSKLEYKTLGRGHWSESR